MPNTSIIVAETLNGNLFPYAASWHLSPEAFAAAVREDALRTMSEGALDIETADDACAFLNEKHAQTTRIITRDEYLAGGNEWPSRIDDAAISAGWRDEDAEAA